MNELIRKLIGEKSENVVYVAGPYSSKNAQGKEDVPVVSQRMQTFSLCLEQMVKVGIKPFSPLLMHLVRCYTDKLPGDWNFWGSYSISLLKKADYVVILTLEGWDKSEDVEQTINYAKDEGIEIIYLNPEQVLRGEFENLADYIFDHKAKDFPRGKGLVAIGKSTRSSIEFEEPEEEVNSEEKKAEFTYPAKFAPALIGYVVTFRDIPEAITQGEDDKDAMEMAEDVLETAFEFYFEDMRPIPMPSMPQGDERQVKVSASMVEKILEHNIKVAKKG